MCCNIGWLWVALACLSHLTSQIILLLYTFTFILFIWIWVIIVLHVSKLSGCTGIIAIYNLALNGSVVLSCKIIVCVVITPHILIWIRYGGSLSNILIWILAMALHSIIGRYSALRKEFRLRLIIILNLVAHIDVQLSDSFWVGITSSTWRVINLYHLLNCSILSTHIMYSR